MAVRTVPGEASVALPEAGEKLFAPSAARNLEPIADLLALIAPQPDGAGGPRPRALEIASGTGQHIVGFARRCPQLEWHPTDVDPARLASINAYSADSGCNNIAPARQLDATEERWPEDLAAFDLVILCNLLHLISTPEAKALIRGAADHLAPGGRFVIYGPFMRAGELISDGDRAFHAKLSSHDPEVGYKDDFDVMDWLQASGLEMVEVIEMPANNLALVARR
ncbi:Methyltransferase domain protein [Phaeobacter inhibens]|uniref:Methyltransferase domain protein n=1 Tax=Phaeobacter inhibens TaxID=221822 RepID=A0ABN5GKI2_9RHOB|nr:DUF938 domain-containing protein [Phaeobacter inhibens]AUQ48816.1 Methyltransferase domain protein [Phaeobacter inhibens]AUQ93316.1 Methyltransferase domain protein [Phaeobacter inhibens]AUR18619.1 Methyltransferase domain protein [Phaeobacter inhibens]